MRSAWNAEAAVFVDYPNFWTTFSSETRSAQLRNFPTRNFPGRRSSPDMVGITFPQIPAKTKAERNGNFQKRAKPRKKKKFHHLGEVENFFVKTVMLRTPPGVKTRLSHILWDIDENHSLRIAAKKIRLH